MNKNIEANVTFKDGSTVTNIVQVDRNKYASLQSKACSYKNALVAGVFSNKLSQAEAVENWNKRVIKNWNSMVDTQLKESYPEPVRDLITDIKPAAGMFSIDGLFSEEA